MLTVESHWLSLDVDPDSVRWSLAPLGADCPRLEAVGMAAAWETGHGKTDWSGRLDGVSVDRFEDEDEFQGPTTWLRLAGMAPAGVAVQLQFGLALKRPFMLLSASLENTAADTIRLHNFRFLDARPSSMVRLSPGPGTPYWYSNGWQSWSFAGVSDRSIQLVGTRLGPLTTPMYLNPETRRLGRGAQWRSDMFALLGDRDSAHAIVVGQLSEQQAFGSLAADRGPAGELGLHVQSALDGIRLGPGERFHLDRVMVELLESADGRPLHRYASAVARENKARVPAEAPTGWSSWYYYFDDVDQADVLRASTWLDEHRDLAPVDFVELDDGYQPFVGDWLERNEGFRDGHAHMVGQIESSGQRAGLWLAPFLAQPRSSIVDAHPDWLLRGRSGRPVRAGYNWNTFVVALDPTHPGVIDYLRSVVRTAVRTWGYRYLKLDFLYAAALPGRRHDPTMTRAQALRAGLEAIRDAAGDQTLLVGCGSPLGPAVGIVDIMRIGPDVAPRWRPAYQGIEAFFQREPSLPSARNAIQNTLARSPLHRRWWLNDPDCALLRASDTHLNEGESRLLTTVIALSGGPMFISDDLGKLDDDRLSWLRRLLPPLPGEPVVPGLLDGTRPQWMRLDLDGAAGQWTLVAAINWRRTSSTVTIDVAKLGLQPGCEYKCLDLWQERLLPPLKQGTELSVPGHGVRLLRLAPAGGGRSPQWLGDTLHLSGGLVVNRWRVRGDRLTVQLESDHRVIGQAWVEVPGRPTRVRLDGGDPTWSEVGDRVARIDIDLHERGELEIEWSPD